MTFDVAAGVAAINKHLKEHDFRATGADGNDFQYGTDPGLRFKTGTSYGEVAVTVWKHQRQVQAIRAMNEEQIVEAKHEIDALIHAYREARRTPTDYEWPDLS